MPETDPPAPEIEAPQAEAGSRRISAVWLVPLLALLLALGVAWNTYARRGPTIEIVFDNAAGVTAGQTTDPLPRRRRRRGREPAALRRPRAR